MRSLFVIGRALFGGFFIYNGLNHLRSVDQMAPDAGSKGVPAPHAAVNATGWLMLAGGASVLAGMKPRQGLAALVAFLVSDDVADASVLGGTGSPEAAQRDNKLLERTSR